MRIGTVGAGGLSTAKIYPCFQRLPVELAAVCDLDEAKAQDRARRFGTGAFYTDVDEMLDSESLDALVVCIDPENHVQMARKAIDRGLHVYTEKPPSLDSASALDLARAADRAGVLAMTAFKKRYTPLYVRMKGAMADMGLEPPAVVSVRRSAGAYAEDGTGRHEFLLDFCLHAIDLAAWLAGPPAEVTAYSPSANAWTVSARTEQGTVLSLALAGASWGFPDEQVAVYGVDRGFIEGRDMRQLLLCADGEMRDVYRVDFSTAGQDGLEVSGFLPEIAAFVEAVNTGDRSGIRSDMWSSYRSMVLYEGIKRSAQTRAPVQLHYEGPIS